jgi:chromate transporter
MESDPKIAPATLADFVWYFLRLGTIGFGGPIALAGYMQRDLVEERRWLSKQDYLDGLALAQLAPGPLAAQLAMYLGWVKGRAWGAALVGIAFVLPSFLMVLALSAIYVGYSGLPWMQSAFYGVGAAIIAIISRSAFKLARITLGKDWLLWTVFLVNAIATAWTQSEIVWLFLLSGIVTLAIRAAKPSAMVMSAVWAPLLAGLHGPAPIGRLAEIGWYFTEAGAFVFGSGLAIVPFLHSGVVERFHWLNDQQFLDAVAVAMITPGPVVITVAFIGYLAAGPLGAVVAAVATFLPCYLFTVLPAPYFQRFAKNRKLRAFVDGVTAAATGAIAGAAFVLGSRAITDIGAAIIAISSLILLVRFKKVSEPALILGAAALGLLVAQS